MWKVYKKKKTKKKRGQAVGPSWNQVKVTARTNEQTGVAFEFCIRVGITFLQLRFLPKLLKKKPTL